MIRSSRWNGQVDMRITNIPKGTYTVFALRLGGQRPRDASASYWMVVRWCTTSSAARPGRGRSWGRGGSSSPGAIRLTTRGGAANISGIEIWRGEGPIPEPARAGHGPVRPRDPAAAGVFDAEVAPILARHCLECHGRSFQEGKLALFTEDAALAGGKSGPVIVPGKPEESLLWEHVDSGEMPKDRPGLSDDEKQILRRWIADGARWGTPEIDPFSVTTDRRAGYDWWSLQPVRPVAPPAVKRSDWPRNDVDRFVLARLEARGLSPGAGGRPADADPPPLVRPDRPAARARGGRAVRRRPGDRRLREARRPPARLAPLRRALGAALAGRGPLRREPGLRVQPHPRQRLALPRLGGRRVQPRPALRRVRQATGRRGRALPEGPRRP